MHDHPHDHGDHHHGAHPFQPDHDRGPATPYEVLERAVRHILVDKGILTEDEIATAIDVLDSRTPALGASVIARAWLEPDYMTRLMDDTRGALADEGIDIGSLADFRAIANTPETHNVVVCTLCSCYPKMLLGMPPAWYKSLAYRARVVRDPRGVLGEFGLTIPADTEVRVHDSTADLRYFIVPMRPPGTDGWTRAQLADIVTRDCMIGTTVPTPPSA